jgi:hypothetical protein
MDILRHATTKLLAALSAETKTNYFLNYLILEYAKKNCENFYETVFKMRISKIHTNLIYDNYPFYATPYI